MPVLTGGIYTPNDWNAPAFNSYGVDYLQFIGARTAWGITKGDPSVIIGITDEDFDTTNLDLKNKFVSVTPSGIQTSHGTHTAGLAAGATDNNYLLPSIGFNCRMNAMALGDWHYEMLLLSSDTTGGRVRVLNGSWLDTPTQANYYPVFIINHQVVADEIYENGVTACYGAGNGRPYVERNTTNYCFPASYDYNISVSSVGHKNDTGVNGLKDIHEYLYAGTLGWTMQHNDRVDICAPGIDVTCLEYHPNDTTHDLTFGGFGTSTSSPIVAGTAALMYSARPCLSPYQLEYLLKKSAKNIYNISYNGNLYNAKYAGSTPYNGRLGAGRLQADVAVDSASSYECNNPATQTMYIDGVSLTHNCFPGTSTSADTPRFKIGAIHNGRPPYKYKWTPVYGNTITIDNDTIASPKITGMQPGFLFPGAYYRLAVYDNSEIQKVASVRFQAILSTDSTSDLSMRDSYFDMLDERNTQFDVNHNHFDIWHSPDLWNRDTADGGTEPQDPQVYYDTAPKPNTIYVRIKNVGCARSAGEATLRLYWTYSSTGEKWKDDWDGTTTLLDSTGGQTPGGGYIDAKTIARLNPGDSTIVRVDWYPPNPKVLKGKPDRLDACLLARLEEQYLPNNGLKFNDSGVTRSATNINNNNNIVTRNLVFLNLGHPCASCRTAAGGPSATDTRRVYIANSESHDQVFKLDMITQKDVERHLAGDVSKYIYVTLHLDSLYDRWQEGGGHGLYATKNAEARTITYDPATPLRLEGINLHAGEHFPVDVTFTLRDSVNVPFDVKDFNIYIRQLIHEGNKDDIYGVVVYNLNIAAGNSQAQSRKAPNAAAASTENTSPYYSAYPNPTTGALNIRYTGAAKTVADVSISDISGKLVIRKSGIALQPGGTYQLRAAHLAPGIYILRTTDSAGNSDTRKITKE